jgi:Sushi repeat (SCR repeat)
MSEDRQYLYRCRKRYHLVGQQRAICDPATGEWTLPTCIRISSNLQHFKIDYRNKPFFLLSTADDFKLPANSINGLMENVEPNLIKYTCIDGFHPSGNGTVTCNETTGQWTSVPSCRSNEFDLLTDCLTSNTFLIPFCILLIFIVIYFILYYYFKCCKAKDTLNCFTINLY